MGQRTQDIADSLKNYVDTFDTRLTSNGGEITASLDQRLLQFETTLGSRVSNLDTSLDSKINSFDSSLGSKIRSFDETIDGRLEIARSRPSIPARSPSPKPSTAASARWRRR